jgi:hypothetical protein
VKEEFEAAVEVGLADKNESTRTYFRAYLALLEEYVTYATSEKELAEKVTALYQAYCAEMANKGLGPEVGWMGRQSA